MKLKKKQGKELKDLRKKHLKKVDHTPIGWQFFLPVSQAGKVRFVGTTFRKLTSLCLFEHLQVWNLSKEQKSRTNQIQSDTRRRRSQMEKNLKRSIKKK